VDAASAATVTTVAMKPPHPAVGSAAASQTLFLTCEAIEAASFFRGRRPESWGAAR
jgi:hypothetical protein